MTQSRAGSILAALGGILGLCTVSGPVSGSPGSLETTALVALSCRIYPTAYTLIQTATANPSFRSTTRATCSFSATALEYACTINYSDSAGTSSTTTSAAIYASLADVVDEVSVIPPLKRLVSVIGTTTVNGRRNTSTGTYTYDSQKRITREASPGTTTTYSAWDGAGRPTRATSTASNGSTTTLSMTYEDAARTMTTSNTQAGVTTRCTQAYDVNGNPTSYICTSSVSGGATNGTMSITSTAQVCRY
jgi:YD repeat-containing protein